MADANEEDPFAEAMGMLARCEAGVAGLSSDSNADVLPVQPVPFFRQRVPTPPPAKRGSLVLEPTLPEPPRAPMVKSQGPAPVFPPLPPPARKLKPSVPSVVEAPLPTAPTPPKPIQPLPRPVARVKNEESAPPEANHYLRKTLAGRPSPTPPLPPPTRLPGGPSRVLKEPDEDDDSRSVYGVQNADSAKASYERLQRRYYGGQQFAQGTGHQGGRGFRRVKYDAATSTCSYASSSKGAAVRRRVWREIKQAEDVVGVAMRTPPEPPPAVSHTGLAYIASTAISSSSSSSSSRPLQAPPKPPAARPSQNAWPPPAENPLYRYTPY